MIGDAEEVERLEIALRVERKRTDAAQAEVARRGDVMHEALAMLQRGDVNGAVVKLHAEVM